MPTLARIVLAGYPHHVVQRGHNRQVVFGSASDYERYLATLAEFKEVFRVKVHAWCLMTNHVHLLLAPSDQTGLARLMKRLAARQTRYRNRLQQRSGTLWEGRYKSSVVQSDRHLLACCRYIELNPVRAGMVTAAQDYPWSSCRARLGYEASTTLDLDPSYLELAADESIRRERYSELLSVPLPAADLELIRTAVQRGRLTGDETIGHHVAAALSRSVENRGQGRPAKNKSVPS